ACDGKTRRKTEEVKFGCKHFELWSLHSDGCCCSRRSAGARASVAVACDKLPFLRKFWASIPRSSGYQFLIQLWLRHLSAAQTNNGSALGGHHRQYPAPRILQSNPLARIDCRIEFAV